MYRTIVFVALLALTLLGSGCGGSGNLFEVLAPKPTPPASPTPPPPVVAVTVSPATASVNGLKSQLFMVEVTGTDNREVTWSVSGAGCSGASCGSMAANGVYGVYKAPATVPSPATVTVTVTSNADSTKSATAAVTVLSTLPVEIAVTPRTATILANKSANLAAPVTNTLNTEVAWTLAGSGCTGAACGAISQSGVYTAPPAAPATVIATATSKADPSKTDRATITVVDTAEALITGTYIYLLDSRSLSAGFAAVGSVTFQGGTFIASEDEEFSSGAGNFETWSGTYTIGSDGRGTVTGTGPNIGTRDLRISVLPADEIRFVEFNNAGPRASGVMRRANATGASLAGDWAFSFSGVDPAGSPMGTIGALQLDSGGGIAGFYALDHSGGLTRGQVSGNYIPPLAGRSVVQLVGLKQTFSWVFYVVSDNELFWVMSGSRDPEITELSGHALRRGGASFAESSLDATAVLSLTGSVRVSAGSVTFDGAIYNSNIRDLRSTSGSVSENMMFTDKYWVDLNGYGEPGSGYAMCLVGPNQAFVLEENGNPMQGEFLPQIGPVGSASLDGTYNFGSERPGNSNTGLVVGVLTSSAGVLSGTADITLPSGNTAGQAVSGSITSFDPATGRGTATLNLPGMSKAVFYFISNGQLVLLPMTPGTPGIDDIGSVIIAGR